MAKKATKKVVKKSVKKEPEGIPMVLGYDLNWMKEVGEQHPDFNKVMKEARKLKYIK